MVQQLGVRKQTTDDVTEIICFLLEHGANINLKNRDGESALDLTDDVMVRHFMEKFHDVESKKQTQKGTMLPRHWNAMGHDESMKRFKIKAGGEGLEKMEYDKVIKLFKRSLPQACVICVERVQNKYLWEVYYLKKRQLEKQYSGIGTANEKELFHGTIPNVVNDICLQNFDMRLAGERVGKLLGHGSYFAAEAKTSDGYASPDSKSHKFMFLAKVLVGKYCVGSSNYNRPPKQNSVDDSSCTLFDSCVDNTRDPRIFCVFDNNQYYPEYIIEYM